MQTKTYKKVYVFEDMDEYENGWQEDGDELLMVGAKNWNVYVSKEGDSSYDDFLVNVSLVSFDNRAAFDLFLLTHDAIDVETDGFQAGETPECYAALVPLKMKKFVAIATDTNGRTVGDPVHFEAASVEDARHWMDEHLDCSCQLSFMEVYDV